MRTEILIVGAGGHAKVVADTILKSTLGCYVRCVVEGNVAKGTELFGGIIVDSLTDWQSLGKDCHVAIGDNVVRERLSLEALVQGKRLVNVVHEKSSVSTLAELGAGSFVAAGAVVSADVVVGDGGIINHGAVVDHDCHLGNFCHVAPNVSLGGGVSVGHRCLIGAGAVVLPGVCLGDDVVVGAGAVVTRDVSNGQTVIGVPARDL